MTSDLFDFLCAEAIKAAPQECCGLLLGNGDTITQIVPAANVHSDPLAHFEIDPAALISAHKSARAGGPSVLGYYHSHPSSPAKPSATDQAMASGDGRIWAIIGVVDDVLFWRDDERGFSALSYQLK